MFRARSLTTGWKEEVDEHNIKFHDLCFFADMDTLFKGCQEKPCSERHEQLVRTFLDPMLLNSHIPLSETMVSDSFVFTFMCYTHETNQDYIIRDYKDPHSLYIYLPKNNSNNLPRFFLSLLNNALEEYLPLTSGIVHSLIEDILKKTKDDSFLSNISFLETCLRHIPRYDRMESKTSNDSGVLYIGPYYFRAEF